MLDCHYYFNDAKRIDNRSQRRIINSTHPGCLNGLYPTETAPQLCIHGVSCLLQQPLPHLSISADGTPACGTRPDIREGREAYPVSSVPVPCTGGGTSPPCGRTTCPGPTWLGTSMLVTRPHAGRRDPGGQRFVPSGPHPHRADAGCADRHATFFLSSGG